MTNKRKHIRTRLRATVQLTHDSLGTVTAALRDLSQGGMFVLTEDWSPPPLGAYVQVQMTGLSGQAPVVTAQVVRIDAEGIGLRFADRDDA